MGNPTPDHEDWIQELTATLTGLFPGEDESGKKVEHAAFHANSGDKFAFLAYTGKVELFVRDELAWRLHQARGVQSGPIGREHQAGPKRIDLVSFDSNGTLEHLLESKALYVGDLLVSGEWREAPHGLLYDLAADIQKATDATNLPCVGLLLLTDIPDFQESVDLAYDGIVKRQSGKVVTHDDVRAELVRLFLRLSGLQLHNRSGVWHGQYKGPVRVHWFLVKT